MKKNILLFVLASLVVPVTFEVAAAHEDEPASTEVKESSCKTGCKRESKCESGCKVREPKACPAKKTCVKKEKPCKKACPRVSKCPTCGQEVKEDEMNDNDDMQAMEEGANDDIAAVEGKAAPRRASIKRSSPQRSRPAAKKAAPKAAQQRAAQPKAASKPVTEQAVQPKAAPRARIMHQSTRGN